MSLRLIEIFSPSDLAGNILSVLAEQPTHGTWQDQLPDENSLLRVLVSSEHTETICDLLEGRFAGREGFRLMLLPVEATIPRIEAPEPEQAPPVAEPPKSKGRRISREELYDDIAETARLSTVYFVMVVLSAVVAAIGLLRGSVAILIGAMVIAPLLGPNVALALATTLADFALARRAIGITVSGIAVALVCAVAMGLVIPVDPSMSELASRTEIGYGDVILALASGVAGALAFTTGVPSALIGVMVAVALVPPLVTAGLMMGSGHWQPAGGAALLLACNIVCINLAGVVTFIAQGIRPRTWCEAEKAKRATWLAIGLWVVLLIVLIVLIALSRAGG
ncbi:MAG: TIGR00341 family protein [Phycisphaerales bacterium]|nr:MAG: TIGR00341 family protein [Phycisphaerales bacterium]